MLLSEWACTLLHVVCTKSDGCCCRDWRHYLPCYKHLAAGGGGGAGSTRWRSPVTAQQHVTAQQALQHSRKLRMLCTPAVLAAGRGHGAVGTACVRTCVLQPHRLQVSTGLCHAVSLINLRSMPAMKWMRARRGTDMHVLQPLQPSHNSHCID